MWKFEGKKIAQAREVHGITQRELARRIGKDPTVVNYWERGRVVPNVNSLLTICNALGCPPRYFFVSAGCDDNHA